MFCAYVDNGAIRVAVPGNIQYRTVGIPLAFRNYIVFKVNVASDAIIGLTTYRDCYNDDMYEIVIGGGANSWTGIRYVNFLSLLQVHCLRFLVFTMKLGKFNQELLTANHIAVI